MTRSGASLRRPETQTGSAPSGPRSTSRVSGGKAVEHSAAIDQLGMLQQRGWPERAITSAGYDFVLG